MGLDKMFGWRMQTWNFPVHRHWLRNGYPEARGGVSWVFLERMFSQFYESLFKQLFLFLSITVHVCKARANSWGTSEGPQGNGAEAIGIFADLKPCLSLRLMLPCVNNSVTWSHHLFFFYMLNRYLFKIMSILELLRNFSFFLSFYLLDLQSNSFFLTLWIPIYLKFFL